MKKIYVIAAVVALLCGVLVYNYFGSLESRAAQSLRAEEKKKTVKVITALEDIPAYSEINDSSIRQIEVEETVAPNGVANYTEQVIGLTCNRDIRAGQFIYSDELKKPEESGAPLSYNIPDGMRAVTIEVNPTTGVGGYITAGDYVDVYVLINNIDIDSTDDDYGDRLTSDNGVARYINPAETVLLAEAVEVLSVGDSDFSESGHGVYTSLTLSYSPGECSRLIAALERGTVFVTLRQRDDESKRDDEYIRTHTELFERISG